MNEIEQIAAAIRSLYTTFARYQRPSKIEYCPCGCTDPGEVLKLLASPLEELRFADLASYSTSAMTTQGSVGDFKYFLPRLLNGIARESYSFNPEMLFGKLKYAKWLEWDEDEIVAVRTYLTALWRVGLSSFPLEHALPPFSEIETLIASIASTDEGLKPYLEIWSATAHQEADQHLIQFVTQYGADFGNGGTLKFAFWEGMPDQAEIIRKWVLKPETIDRVERSRHLLPQDGYEHLFGPALRILQSE